MKLCRCEGEAKRRQHKGRQSVADAEEGEASPMWRNQSVAGAKGRRSITNAEEGEASSMLRKVKHCRCREIEVSSIRRYQSVTNVEIVANRSYQRRFRFYRRRHQFGEIEASPMLKSLRIVRIDDGLSGLSVMVQVVYRRRIGFLRIVAWFLLGSRWVWFFWE